MRITRGILGPRARWRPTSRLMTPTIRAPPEELAMAQAHLGLMVVCLAASSAAAQSAPGDGSFPGLSSTMTVVGPSGTLGADQVGRSIALDGDTLVVGAPDYDGLPGDSNTGAVFVFVRHGAGWIQQAKLTASDAHVGDGFGTAVAVSDDLILVGTPAAEPAGLNGAGVVFRFQRTGSTWTEQPPLLDDPPTSAAAFGASVAIVGDRIVVGAPGGPKPFASFVGRALVFHQSGGAWVVETVLRSPYPDLGDSFGESVDLDGTRVVASASGDDTQGAKAGALYVFVRSDDEWDFESKLVPAAGAAGDELGSGQTTDGMGGRGVAIDGDTILAGSAFADPGGLSSAGAAWVFVLSATGWTEQAQLVAPDGLPGDQFGASVALDGNLAVVAADLHPAGTQVQAGAAYVFARNGDAWSSVAQLVSPDILAYSHLGCSLDVQGDTVALGRPRFAPFAPTPDTGVAHVAELDGAWTD